MRLPREAAHASFDALALEKVFANLLGNAFKFTPAGGHVTLTASRLEVGEPALEILEKRKSETKETAA